jgi:hypothetical protein
MAESTYTSSGSAFLVTDGTSFENRRLATTTIDHPPDSASQISSDIDVYSDWEQESTAGTLLTDVAEIATARDSDILSMAAQKPLNKIAISSPLRSRFPDRPWPLRSKARSDRRFYVDLLFRKTNMYANYSPENPIDLGDYGDLSKDGEFIRLGNILEDNPLLRDVVECSKESVGLTNTFLRLKMQDLTHFELSTQREFVLIWRRTI